MNFKYLLILLSFALFSCVQGPEPKVWMEKDTSLSCYKAFEVLPTQNETGKTFDFDVGGALTKQLVDKLRAKGYSVKSASDQDTETLLIKSTIVAYETGSSVAVVPRAAYCTVRSALVDKRTEKLVAEMVTSREARTGGFLLNGVVGAVALAGADNRIIESVAEGIVDELGKKIK
jgi:hypothetical protein